MSVDLLEKLEAAAPVAGNLENIEDLIRVFAREVSYAVNGMKGSALLFEDVWRRLILDVAGGKTAETQAFRPRLLKAFEERLALLEHAYDRAAWLCQLGRADVSKPDVLLPEINGMEALKVNVFDRWQSTEDLERLAVEYYPLTQARLETIAAAHCPLRNGTPGRRTTLPRVGGPSWPTCAAAASSEWKYSTRKIAIRSRRPASSSPRRPRYDPTAM